ncbi:MAG TPA: hypothetical protein VMW52_01580 [Phycisphaerae bacterium]|nr:hypothetical protein [Phycisphaerae bacterium]
MKRVQTPLQASRSRLRRLRLAIRTHCVGCSGGVAAEVARCPLESCELHPHRMGRARRVGDRQLLLTAH